MAKTTRNIATTRPCLVAYRHTKGGKLSEAFSMPNPILLCVWANLFAAFDTAVKGSGWIALIGSYNLWATDLAVLASLPAIVRWAVGRGAVGIATDGDTITAPRWL